MLESHRRSTNVSHNEMYILASLALADSFNLLEIIANSAPSFTTTQWAAISKLLMQLLIF